MTPQVLAAQPAARQPGRPTTEVARSALLRSAWPASQLADQRPRLTGDSSDPDLVVAEALLASQTLALTTRLAKKDPYTAGHTRRVARRAVQVAEALGLPPAVLRAVAIGGLLHDIGKLSIPDAILNKPGALDAGEYAIIRRHPEDGEQLIRCLGGFSPQVLRLVRNHHERLDGRGYPHGLTGDQLDLPTRVLSVCDVYDALISNRVYRPAWSQEQALERLRAEIGGAFDRRCVAALHHVAEDERPRPTVKMAEKKTPRPCQGHPQHTA